MPSYHLSANKVTVSVKGSFVWADSIGFDTHTSTVTGAIGAVGVIGQARPPSRQHSTAAGWTVQRGMHARRSQNVRVLPLSPHARGTYDDLQTAQPVRIWLPLQVSGLDLRATAGLEGRVGRRWYVRTTNGPSAVLSAKQRPTPKPANYARRQSFLAAGAGSTKKHC
ncbi:hypothetical protein HDV57DRAFT_60093 [Trichoderma longibrachiatum]|uniref:Uncharacterized protein n=1 Tax=Trichoderma longibrachiatum ATCC 18648 TaxID=983965 RepID=A0A2T4CET3_TRILO|nr:hypothetical protein M440DRAFT_179344 [Trichoderma longibrachiatum ATCC 18648]